MSERNVGGAICILCHALECVHSKELDSSFQVRGLGVAGVGRGVGRGYPLAHPLPSLSLDLSVLAVGYVCDITDVVDLSTLPETVCETV